jgi:hypothetical protein
VGCKRLPTLNVAIAPERQENSGAHARIFKSHGH